MDIKVLENNLTNEDFRPVRTGLDWLHIYSKAVDSTNNAVILIDFDNSDIQFAERLLHIRQSINNMFMGNGMGETNTISVVFTSNPDRAKFILQDDNSHWIYSMNEDRLMIFDDQPDDFLNLRNIIENGNAMYKNNIIKRILTFNNVIVLANIIVFICLEAIGDTTQTSFLVSHGAFTTDGFFDNREYYTLFTSMFMHAGFMHLFNNMLVLFFIGDIVERKIGHLRYLITYIMSGLLSGFIAGVYYSIGSEAVCCIGASGAIFGVIGTLLLLVIVNKGRLGDVSFTRLILYIVLSIDLGVTSTDVSNVAHIGGLISGFIIAAIFFIFSYIETERKRGNI